MAMPTTPHTKQASHVNHSKVRVEHTPFDPELWTGRYEPDETTRARYWYQVVQGGIDKDVTPKVGLVGFACDQGVRRNLGRVGARHAPATIRRAFAKLPLSSWLQDRLGITERDSSVEAKLDAILLASLLVDMGDIVCHDDNALVDDVLEQTQAQYRTQVTKLIEQGTLPFGLGGGHAMAYGSYLGLWHALQPNAGHSSVPRIGTINFDAHLDIRNAPAGTSGTPFRQIAEHNEAHNQPFHYCAIGISQFSNSAALFDRAENLNIDIISDDDCARLPWEKIEAQIDTFINNVDVVYLTIDMDGFAASTVPGVSAPAAKGMQVDFVERCIEHIFASGKVKMADIAEINPTFDIDGRSSKVAARLLALMVEYHLLLTV